MKKKKMIRRNKHGNIFGRCVAGAQRKRRIADQHGWILGEERVGRNIVTA
jgi:hypothetical protein